MDGDKKYAVYNRFSIGDENSLYKMSKGGFSGTVPDSLTCSNRVFVTFDKDINDMATTMHKSGWWLCAPTNLNGIMKEQTNSDRDHVYWRNFRTDSGFGPLLRKTKMTLILKTSN